MTSVNTVVSSRRVSRPIASSFAAASVIVLGAACSSSSSGGDGGNGSASVTICGPHTPLAQPAAVTCGSPGGEVAGSPDTHCSMNGMQVAQVTTTCPMGAVASDDSGSSAGDSASGGDGGGPADAAAGGDAGPDDGTCGMEDTYGPTMNGHMGSDDDCKYDVSWTSTPICENGNVYFTVTVKKRAFPDGGSAIGGAEPPMTGGTVAPDITLNCTHPAPNSNPTFVEEPAGSGIYKVGPIQFDRKGKWDVRFHFNECCNDGMTSPHGHAAFWINVP
jgi:hypothetical protein